MENYKEINVTNHVFPISSTGIVLPTTNRYDAMLLFT
jgi:hypothetical protein